MKHRGGSAHRHTPDSSGKPLCKAQSLERIAGIGPKNGMLLLFLLGNHVLNHLSCIVGGSAIRHEVGNCFTYCAHLFSFSYSFSF